MFNPDLRNTLKAFARKEFFNPDVLYAIIVTLGLVVPLAVGHYLDEPLLGGFAAVTGQNLLVIKFQHTYPQRALILFIGLIFITAAVLAGTLLGAYFGLAIFFMALIAGISSLLKEFGSFGQVIGFCAVIIFLLALPPPHSLDIGLDRYVAVWLGGLWAAFITLFFWFFLPDLPYYTSIARPWELSSNLAVFLASANVRKNYAERVQEKEINLRQAINDVLPYLRLHHVRYFFIRRDLLKVVRASSRFGVTIMAMNHALEHLREHPKKHLFMPAVQERLFLAAAGAKIIVNALVLARPQELDKLTEIIIKLKTSTEQLQKLTDSNQKDFTIQVDLHRFITLLDSATHYLEDAHYLLTRIRQKKQLPTTQVAAQNKTRLLPPLRALFQFKNVPLKHTLRLMLVTSIGVALYLGFQIPRGYWIPLTVMVVLQPDFGTTQQKAMQRVLGTFLGGILGTMLLIHPFSPVIFILAITTFSFLFLYYQQRNYAVSVTFLTMMLVAMFEVSGPIDWHLAAYRLFATVLGVILSVTAAFLLWPDWERTKVRFVMARGLRANFNLLQQLHHELLSQTGFHARIIADRRKAESANIEIAESVKRLQLEPGTKKQKQKIAQNLAFYNVRLSRELLSLAALLPQIKVDTPTYAETDAYLSQAADQLEEIMTALITEKNVAGNIPKDLPFPAQKFNLELKPVLVSTATNTGLHLDTEILQTEIVHEQLNKISDAIFNMNQLVFNLNQL
ncbi:MAG: FUSC family protein [Adhaeribacter sp.]